MVHSKSLLLEANHQLIKESTSFKHEAVRSLTTNKLAMLQSSQKLVRNVQSSLQQSRQRLQKNEHDFGSSSIALLREYKHRLDTTVNQLPFQTKSTFHLNEARLNHLIQSMRLLDPINVLKRGYSITILDGKTIDESNQPISGKKITTRTVNYSIESTIDSIEKLKKNR